MSLRRNFTWTFAGNIVYAACQWGVIVVIAKVLDPAAVGEYALALAITGPISIFFNFKLRSVVASDVRGEYAFADYLRLRVLSTIAALIVVAGVCLVSGYQSERVSLIAIVAITKAVDSIGDVFQGVMQSVERMNIVAGSWILNGLATLAGVVAALVWFGDLILAALASLAASIIVHALYTIPAVVRLRIVGVDVGAMKLLGELSVSQLVATRGSLFKLTVLGLPLGLVTALGSLKVNVPRLVIEYDLGAHALGVFAAVSYVVVAGGLIMNALAQSATPRLARYYQNNDFRRFGELLAKLVALGIGVGVAGLALAVGIGAEMLQLLYNAAYSAHKDLLIGVAAATAVTFAYIFLGTAASAMRLFRVQLPIGVASFATVATASYLLIPHFGLMGAAYALIVSAIVECTLYLWVVRRRLTLKSIAPARDLGKEP